MDFAATKTPVQAFILVLIVKGIESHGKNLMSQKTLIKIIIAQIIVMLVLINIKLNVDHH